MTQGPLDGQRIVIIGGGLAGLSLALHLSERDLGASIRILEPRQGYCDDRTWAFWATVPHLFSDLPYHHWQAWTIAGPGGEVVCRSQRYPYCCLRSSQVYAAATQRLAARSEVTIETGRRVHGLDARPDRVILETDAGALTADWVYDSRPPAALPASTAGHPTLVQDFVGWRVRTNAPLWDPETADLMRFQPGPDDGVRFHYTLPLSAHEALVETTVFARSAKSRDSHRADLRAAMSARAGDAWTLMGEECGRIPMATGPLPPAPGRRVVPIGTRAGAPRPSTGYAFLPIQRHSAALARIAAKGRPAPVPVRSAWTHWLDRVFLRYLDDDPTAGPALFDRLFRGTPPDRLVRFLSECGSPVDHLAAMRALPILPFLRTAAAVSLQHPMAAASPAAR